MYLEDLAVGQRFASASLELDADAIRDFAARFDPQPFHLDDEAARSTLFGGLIGAGIDELRWPRPTRPGDRLKVGIEVLEITPSRSKLDRGMVRILITTLNQAGEVVQSCIGRVLVWRRPV